MGTDNQLTGSSVELTARDGVAFIEQDSPLTRLHYFDGKFLRADVFALEQDYHRTRTRLGNLAGGWGVVHGFSIRLDGNRLEIGGGLAITADGNFVLATSNFGAAISELIQVATPAPSGGNSDFGPCPETSNKQVTESGGLTIHEITVGPVEGLCGQEAVFGKLCESACASSSQRPFWREGVVLRLRPITLSLPTSSAVLFNSTHLRNRVASAYFAAEPWLTPSALSASGLANEVWCNPATLYSRDEVVIGLLVREAGVNRVIDAWSARRERMDRQARGYWQGRMEMRPWNVFIAQILQFQCQLSGVFDGTGGPMVPPDECDELRALLARTQNQLVALHSRYSESTQRILRQVSGNATQLNFQQMSDQLTTSRAALFEISQQLAKANLGAPALPTHRLLLNAGFVELPPAGYLPVSTAGENLGDQMSRLFGEGVHLDYRTVRRDEIPHLLEQAQHLQRISLTRGLDDASRIENVEIFVPDGELLATQPQSPPGEWWHVELPFQSLSLLELPFGNGTAIRKQRVRNLDASATAPAARTEYDRLRKLVSTRKISGLMRTEARSDGSFGFALAGHYQIDDLIAGMRQVLRDHPELDAGGDLTEDIRFIMGQASIYCSGDIDRDPLAVGIGERVSLEAEVLLPNVTDETRGFLTVVADQPLTGLIERLIRPLFLSTAADKPEAIDPGQFGIFRQGNGRDGELVLHRLATPTASPLFFDWNDAPRSAELFVLDPAVTSVSSNRSNVLDGTVLAEGGLGALGNRISLPTEGRRQLLVMQGLPGMPGLDSALGVATLNVLTTIAQAVNRPDFFVRARHRLFPGSDAPALERLPVRPVLDWIMFRRARTLLCCDEAPTPVQPRADLVSLWHVAVTTRKELAALRQALSSNAGLAAFDFQRVGLVRYRPGNTTVEESSLQLETLWHAVKAGTDVVLGRYWEGPGAIPGQNALRLNNLLEQIRDITTPPPAEAEAIDRLEAPPPPLQDPTTPNGFLVVTTRRSVHRVLFIPFERYAQYRGELREQPLAAEEAWTHLAAQATNTLTLHFENGALDPTDRGTLASADNNAGGDTGLAIAVRIDSRRQRQVDAARAEYDVISVTVGALRGGIGDSGRSYTVPDEDLGSGALSATVLVYLLQTGTGGTYYYYAPYYRVPKANYYYYYGAAYMRGVYYYMPFYTYQRVFGGQAVGGDGL